MEGINRIIRGEICPYCNCETKLVSGEFIYPDKKHLNPRPDFLDKSYLVCLINPDHYVGTYDHTGQALGRLADKALRNLKRKGHLAFDPLWKDKKHFKSQKAAYRWLSKKMKLPTELTHFGMFTEEQCAEAIYCCNEFFLSK